jgi:hypothetical protein
LKLFVYKSKVSPARDGDILDLSWWVQHEQMTLGDHKEEALTRSLLLTLLYMLQSADLYITSILLLSSPLPTVFVVTWIMNEILMFPYRIV